MACHRHIVFNCPKLFFLRTTPTAIRCSTRSPKSLSAMFTATHTTLQFSPLYPFVESMRSMLGAHGIFLVLLSASSSENQMPDTAHVPSDSTKSRSTSSLVRLIGRPRRFALARIRANIPSINPGLVICDNTASLRCAVVNADTPLIRSVLITRARRLVNPRSSSYRRASCSASLLFSPSASICLP